MISPDFKRQLQGYGLTTASILYGMPDHPSVLQTFVWQALDIAPRAWGPAPTGASPFTSSLESRSVRPPLRTSTVDSEPVLSSDTDELPIGDASVSPAPVFEAAKRRSWRVGSAPEFSARTTGPSALLVALAPRSRPSSASSFPAASRMRRFWVTEMRSARTERAEISSSTRGARLKNI